MAARPLNKAIADAVVVDWRLGQMSQRDLADKHKISVGMVSKLCKGVEQDMLPLNRSPFNTVPPNFVYLITAEQYVGIYKIGLTNDVTRRLNDMQTGSPYTLYAIRSYQVENAVAVEAMLHAFFHKKRIRGEWFNLTAQDIQYIDDALESVDEVINGER